LETLAGNTDSFGYWLKRRRKALDLTQAALADQVGCALVTIKKIEADERRPSRQIAARLAEALAIPEDEREAFIQTARGLQAVHRLEMAQEPIQASIPAASETPLQVEATPVTILHPERLVELVGRSHELALIRRFWEEAQAGQMKVLLVQGEPGIGKTRLVEELLSELHQPGNGAGPVELRGGCYEFEATTPYLPIVEALRGWLDAQPLQTRRALLGEAAADLAHIIPDLYTQLGIEPEPFSGSMQEQRLRLYDAVGRTLNQLAMTYGLVLFIDDLHWIDQGTLALLAYLLRQLRHSPVLFVTTYREAEFESQAELGAARADWRRHYNAREISLQRLSLEDTNALLSKMFAQDRVSEEFAEAVYTETEGNPFFIVELAYALIDHGMIYRVEDRWERKSVDELELPSSIRDTIEHRLARLSPECLQLLRYAALLGKQFSFPELVAVMETPEERLLDPLDEALQARLILAGEADIFRFSHDKIREVLYLDQNPARQRLLHRQCAERLERYYQAALEGQAARLAYHYYQAGSHAQALPYARLAAERAKQMFAPDEAQIYLEQALACAAALDQLDTQADIHEEMGDLYAQNAPFDRAIQHYQRVAALVDDFPRQLAVQVKLGQVYSDIGDPRGQPILEAALKVINPKQQPAVWVGAQTALGRFLHYQAHYSQALAHYEKALPMLEETGDPWLTTKVYGFISGCYQHLTQFGESNTWAQKTIAYGQEHNYPHAEATGYEFLAENWVMQGYWEQSVEAAQIDVQIGSQIGSEDRVAWGQFSLALAYHHLGDFKQSERYFTECAENAECINAQRLAALNAVYFMRLLVDLGQDGRALAFGRQYLASTDELGETQLRYVCRLSMAYLYRQTGDPERALEWVLQAMPLLDGSQNRSMPLLNTPLEAGVYLDLGDLETAAARARAGVEHARQADAPYYLAENLAVLGQAAAAQGDYETVESSFAEAQELLLATSSRLGLGRLYAARAGYYQQIGEPEAAQADRDQARQIFVEIGAAHDLAALDR
jgi:transcriptional regulator with XRE-family HTH domain